MSTTTPTSTPARNSSRRTKASNPPRHTRASRRTTITLSPDAQEIVERFRHANGTSTSAAIDQIIQRSEPKPSRLKKVNGRLVLDIPGKPLHFTLEDLKQAEDDMDREYVERFLPSGWKPAYKANRPGKRQ